jgi:UDP-3-O-[3-hydroxymyristoyl] glucosamine N-acyltransferase
VGARVTIAPHAIIGCSGMGYERDADGRWVRFPQLGGVRIEDDVDVAAHATVQRGTLGDTLIRRGAKIGPHVNIGHNVDVGEDVLISGHSQIGGGARIGRGAVIWQAAVVANGVTVGEGAVIGMAAAVRKDVGAGEVWAGNPARKLR